MRPSYVSQTGTGTTSWIPLDLYKTSFSVSVAVVVSGTVTYSIQHTFDDVYDSNVTPVPFDHDSVTSESSNAFGTYDYPVTAVRINVSAGSGTAEGTIIQAGGPE